MEQALRPATAGAVPAAGGLLLPELRRRPNSSGPMPWEHRAPGVRISCVSKRSRLLITVSAIAAVLLALVVAASAVFCGATLHVWTNTRNEPRIPDYAAYPGSVWQGVAVKAPDKVVLRGWFVHAGPPGPRCVAVLHGIADTRVGAAGFAPMFLEAGYSVLLPDSRAHGESGGELVTYGLLEKYDVLEWVRWMRQQGCTRIYGLGESLGASVLIQAAALEPDFNSIVAECPYADLKSVAEFRTRKVLHLPGAVAPLLSKGIVRGGMIYARVQYGLDFRQASPVSDMARTSTPVLLIHGAADSETPCWHSQQLAQANPRAVLWVVPGAGHVGASAADPQGFRTRVLNWFARH